MLTIDALREYGADVEQGLSRCMNNEAFYLRLVGMTLNDKNFDALRAALKVGDLDRAFDAAHSLKGVLGNLALTPIYDEVYRLTELLRSRTDMDYSGSVAAIDEKRAELTKLAE